MSDLKIKNVAKDIFDSVLTLTDEQFKEFKEEFFNFIKEEKFIKLANIMIPILEEHRNNYNNSNSNC